MDHKSIGVAVPCPECGKPTESLKRYRMPEWFIFAYLFFWWRVKTYTACPSCMRRITVQRLVFNLIPANLVMIALGPFYLVRLLMTFDSGHSREIEEIIARAVARPRAS